MGVGKDLSPIVELEPVHVGGYGSSPAGFAGLEQELRHLPDAVVEFSAGAGWGGFAPMPCLRLASRETVPTPGEDRYAVVDALLAEHRGGGEGRRQIRSGFDFSEQEGLNCIARNGVVRYCVVR